MNPPMDNQNNILMAFISNGKGEFPDLSLHNGVFPKLVFSSVTGEEVKIGTDSLFGFSADIDVIMNDEQIVYGKSHCTIQYTISRLRKNEITLIGDINEERVVLTRN